MPISPTVKAAADLLGLEPLSLANEGKMLFVVKNRTAEKLLAKLQAHPLGRKAAIIGTVESGAGEVIMKTVYGGKRLVDLPAGIPLPRIC